mmetsp:Transcript_25966/g.29705  ORF Transcript_25966/g.29705 Transcript_25966/m.29705 type:complete len:169 (-) Transcript_25966:128-634(-)|eukprot:CAMPEP_0194130582 /NCGR_PEP_ID=MMETSP0152-20130528/1603_1 /TAXON_ID=1049557 /ORGANISM="Thalassiothrix antarctica, Strain L6-D1" /LENGTH=168 /DNA_ID=CAMNT_0038825151 /DNA_START=110 /DNA_END=616 /DNA_ORIENTATION=+
MGGKARTKKRRSGRIGRTKLKNRFNFKRFDPNPKIKDKIIRENWDPSKSPSANLASMGLQAEPNINPAAKNNRTGTTKGVIELYDIPESDELGSKSKRQFPMFSIDQRYIARCFDKYGDDYNRMFMDIKTNNMQYSESQLKKMGSRFLLLGKDQREIDVPEGVKHLVP